MPNKTVVMPGATVSWDTFTGGAYPPRSIAADGFTVAPPLEIDYSGPYLNIDHHHFCNRMATRSSCALALYAIQAGLLDELFSPDATLYMNGCDEDNLFTHYAFQNPRAVWDRVFARMVAIEDPIDAHNGFCAVNDDENNLRHVAWVTKPYVDARVSGALHRMSGPDMLSMLDEMSRRIDFVRRGVGEKIAPDMEHQIVREFNGWALVREIGPHARYALAKHKIRAFVAIAPFGEGRNQVRIVRQAPFVRAFAPFEALAKVFNEADGIGPHEMDRWGGSDLCLCSPRTRATPLTEEQVIGILLRAKADEMSRAAAA